MSFFNNLSNAVNRVSGQFQSLQQQLGSRIRQVSTTVNTVVGTINAVSGTVRGITSLFNGFSIGDIDSPNQFMSRVRAQDLFPGAEPVTPNRVTARPSSVAEGDWRVRLSIPTSMSGSPILTPLKNTDGLVWPYTPTILIQHSADYNMLAPVHNNYPFPVYQGSKIEQFTITGEFIVENFDDARYWVAAVHYLRSLTKMDYGENGTGNPPLTVRLNGYGDFVFNNVPVVITNFQIDLPQDVDYVSTNMEVQGARENARDNGFAFSYVPTVSTIAVTVQPIYSRSQVERFSLQRFVNGDYIANDNGFM